METTGQLGTAVWRYSSTLILDLYTRWKLLVSFTFRGSGRGVGGVILYLLNRKLLGPHGWSGAFGEEKYFRLPGIT